MDTASVFTSGNSQAVRLPKEYRFDSDRVFIKRSGRNVILMPIDVDPWDVFEEGLAMFSDDFMKERPDQGVQDRKDLFS